MIIIIIVTERIELRSVMTIIIIIVIEGCYEEEH